MLYEMEFEDDVSDSSKELTLGPNDCKLSIQ